MVKYACLVAIVALMVPALAEHAAPSGTAAAPAAQGDTSSNELDQVVCKILPPPTGTRIGARKVCHTERQWRQLMDDSQDYLKTQQNKALGWGGPQG